MILTPLSFIYRGAIRFRHFLYDHSILKKKIAPLPVISIGNVMAGGVGKTQVALLLGELLAKDVRVAILCRGYRGAAEHAKDPLVVNLLTHSARECGDEPFLLSSRLGLSSLIIVNKNRFKSSLMAKKLGAQLIMLDDGMQHRRLHRDYEITVIDGNTSFGSYLPKGRLREDLKRLKTSDLILFIAKPQQIIQEQVAALSPAPQVVAKIIPEGLFQLDGQKIASLAGKKVALFCGIGNPLRFVKTVEELGADIVATHFSADHRFMGERSLSKFAILALQRGASMLVCSEKDRVKFSSTYKLPLPICWLQVTLEIVENQAAWIEAVNMLKALGRGRL